MLAYLNQPASAHGVKGVPTLRGLQVYLEAALAGAGQNADGLRFVLDEDGLRFGLTAALSARVEDLALDVGAQFGNIGLEIEGDLRVDASFDAAIDFDLALDNEGSASSGSGDSARVHRGTLDAVAGRASIVAGKVSVRVAYAPIIARASAMAAAGVRMGLTMPRNRAVVAKT